MRGLNAAAHHLLWKELRRESARSGPDGFAIHASLGRDYIEIRAGRHQFLYSIKMTMAADAVLLDVSRACHVHRPENGRPKQTCVGKQLITGSLPLGEAATFSVYATQSIDEIREDFGQFDNLETLIDTTEEQIQAIARQFSATVVEWELIPPQLCCQMNPPRLSCQLSFSTRSFQWAFNLFVECKPDSYIFSKLVNRPRPTKLIVEGRPDSYIFPGFINQGIYRSVPDGVLSTQFIAEQPAQVPTTVEAYCRDAHKHFTALSMPLLEENLLTSLRRALLVNKVLNLGATINANNTTDRQWAKDLIELANQNLALMSLADVLTRQYALKSWFLTLLEHQCFPAESERDLEQRITNIQREWRMFFPGMGPDRDPGTIYRENLGAKQGDVLTNSRSREFDWFLNKASLEDVLLFMGLLPQLA